MADLRWPGNRFVALAALFGTLAALRPTPAQQPQPPTLDQILQRLEDNLNQYNTSIPSFFCDEHVVSGVSPPSQVTITDSTFRLARTRNPDQTIVLTETRDVREVDGHAASGEVLSGPAIVSGAFSGGFAVVSLSQRACMRYTLHPLKPGAAYMVSFATVPGAERPPNCLLRDDVSGAVSIDPATMQVTHVTVIAMHHTIIPGGTTAKGAATAPLVGPWIISIEYAPVVLDGSPYWLPTAIDSSAISESSRRALWTSNAWTFKAEYSNYHKLEVTSHVVPGSVAPIQ